MCHHRLQRSEGPDRHKELAVSISSKLRLFARETFFLSALSLAKTFVMCCLVLCLAFSEFPESLSLSDDACNDFIVVNEVCAAIDSEAAEALDVPRDATHPSQQLLLSSSNTESALPEAIPALDLLPLISLRRI